MTEFVDGHQVVTSPPDTTLTAHRLIELDVGTPLVPPSPVTFPPGL